MLASDGTVDTASTDRLRSELAKKRGETQLFDFGGSLEELKARCQSDTGLKPPEQPRFQTWVREDREISAR